MSDDDFRSLFDDEEPDEKPSDESPNWLEDDTPDWVKDEDDQPPAEGGRSGNLGFTGELEWRQELGDPFADLGAGDEDTPDWQRGESASSTDRPAGSGLTGQLDWLRDDEEDAAPAPAPGGGLQAEHPSWLDEPETAQPENSAPVDMPPWLMGADNEADQGIFIDEQGQLSEDWLASGDALAETHQSDITYDEWRSQQEEANRQLDPEEQVPSDLFTGMDAPTEDSGDLLKQGTDEVPDWYLGMEKLDTSEAPDWFSDAETPAAPVPAQEDLLGDFELQVDDTSSGDVPSQFDLEQALANDISGGDVPDWLAATSSEADLHDELTLEQSMTGIEDWPSESDLMGELNLEQTISEEEPAIEAELDLMDELGLEQSIAESSDVPDWFSAPADEDLLEELDLEQSMAASGDDLLSGLELEPSLESPDWFAEEKAPDQPDWLQQLGEISAAETIMQGSEAVPAEDDFLAELMAADELPDPAMPAFQDIDSLLASMGETEAKLPDTGQLLLDPNPELEDVLTEDAFGTAEPQARPDSQLSPDAPAWLTELGATVGNVSAAAIVRQRKDRPLEDLSDRLKNLQQRGEDLAVPELDEEEVHDTLAGLLPGVSQVLTPARIQPGLPGFTGDVALTDVQRDRVKMLKSLVAAEEDVQRPSSAIERTYDSPYMEGLLDEDEELIEAPVVVEPTPAPRARKPRQRIKVDRLIISLIVAASVILPFYVGQLRLGSLPAAGFAVGSVQQAAFDRVEAVQSGDLVLLAVEYGPTSAAELDSLTDVLLRHILTRGAVPVVVSGNPVGLLHANNVLETINADAGFLSRLNRTAAFQANDDYYVLQYLAGSAVGLRGLSQNPAQYLTSDLRGQATNLTVSSLSDFALLVVIAEHADDTRAWAEQVVPAAGAPVVFATGFSAAPLAEPYVQSQLGAGLLVGYRDAYTYQILLDPSLAPPATPTGVPVTPEIVPSETPVPPTEVPTEAPTLEPTSAEVIAPQAASPTAEPTEVVPTATTVPLTPTTEVAATSTVEPTARPSATPAPSATPTELPALTGIVDASQTINVRGGPGTDNPVVTTLDPGAEVRVLGRNADGSWIQIQLDDGTEGWVSAELLDIQEPEASADKPHVLARMMAQETTPTPEQAPEATAEAASSEAASSVAAGSPYRDERWYSMTFGIIVIVVIIALGSIINVLRSLLGRRDR